MRVVVTLTCGAAHNSDTDSPKIFFMFDILRSHSKLATIFSFNRLDDKLATALSGVSAHPLLPVRIGVTLISIIIKVVKILFYNL